MSLHILCHARSLDDLRWRVVIERFQPRKQLIVLIGLVAHQAAACFLRPQSPEGEVSFGGGPLSSRIELNLYAGTTIDLPTVYLPVSESFGVLDILDSTQVYLCKIFGCYETLPLLPK